MKLVSILILISLNCTGQALFKPGPYALGIHVTDMYGTVWKTRQAGTFTTISTTYFSFVRFGPSVIDGLSARIATLEARTAGGTTDLTSILARLAALEKPMYLSSTDFLQVGDSIKLKPTYLSGTDFEQVGDSVRLRPVIFNSLDFYIAPDKTIRVKK